jgi:hypothetical protein
MTEKELVYSIIETLNSNQYTNDNKITERLVRNLLASYRGEVIRKYYSEGEDISEECFQYTKVAFTKERDNIFKADLPQIIRFSNRNGFFFEKIGISIPSVNMTTFSIAECNDLPLISTTGNVARLKLATELSYEVKYNSDKYILYQVLNVLNSTSSKKDSTLDLRAVLVNPSDASDYNWLEDVYPFPAEKIDELKTTILRKEFGITSQVKPDEIQNARVDNVRYHENTNLEQ